MKRSPLPLVSVVGLILIGCQPVAQNQAEAQAPARNEHSKTEVELVGLLRLPRSSKSAYRLEIYPPSNQKVIELLGDRLKGIPDQTPVWVKGVVKSQVVGPAKGDADQYPIQWGIWLRVAEVQTFPSLDEAFRGPRERHLRQ